MTSAGLGGRIREPAGIWPVGYPTDATRNTVLTRNAPWRHKDAEGPYTPLPAFGEAVVPGHGRHKRHERATAPRSVERGAARSHRRPARFGEVVVRRSLHRVTDDAQAVELEPSEEPRAARALETAFRRCTSSTRAW
jgi:hypothetical protein